MADNDKSLFNLRYNQVTQGLEGFGGGTPQWTPLTLSADGNVNGIKITGGLTNTGLITLAAGTNVTITNSPTGTFTINASSGGGNFVRYFPLDRVNSSNITTATLTTPAFFGIYTIYATLVGNTGSGDTLSVSITYADETGPQTMNLMTDTLSPTVHDFFFPSAFRAVAGTPINITFTGSTITTNTFDLHVRLESSFV